MARQVLPIVGAVVGAYFGNPQLGYAIGAIIGNAVDPLHVKGPRLREGPSQSYGEGSYRQVVYGTSWIWETQVLEVGPIRKVTVEEQQGKGGGPVTESERGYQTFAIGLGEPLEAIRVLRMDGKIVYDVRPGSAMLAESAAFAERFRFYTGAEDQLPDPDLEALPGNGVGNTAYYRGTAYLVFPNYDVTDLVGRIPVVEVEGCKTATVNQLASLVTDSDVYEGGPESLEISIPDLWGFSPVFKSISVSPGGQYAAAGMSGSPFLQLREWNQTTQTFDIISLPAVAPTASVIGTAWSGDGQYFAVIQQSTTGFILYRVQNGVFTAIANEPVAIALESVDISPDGSKLAISYGNAASSVSVFPIIGSVLGEASTIETAVNAFGQKCIKFSPDGLWLACGGTDGLEVIRTASAEIELWDSVESSPNCRRGVVWSEGGNYIYTLSTIEVSGNFLTVWEFNAAAIVSEAIVGSTFPAHQPLAGGGLSIQGSFLAVAEDEPQPLIYEISDNGAILTPVVTQPESGDTVSQVAWTNSTIGTVDGDGILLSALVEDICGRCGISASQLDLSELTDEVDGVTLGGPYDGAGAITTLMPAFFFDIFEADHKLRMPKRGGAVKATITVDDLIEEPDENILRGQDIEYPRALLLKYLDPDQNYAAPAAPVQRTSPDIRVRGEATAELPIAMSRTMAFRVADRMLKVMWEDLNGEVVFSLPSGPFAWLTPTDCLGVSLRGALYRVRVEKVEHAGGVVKVTARRDRQSAYTSVLTPLPLPAPTPPPPSLAGATQFVVLNIPGIADSDNGQLGVRVGVCGLDGFAWSGCAVRVSSDGGLSWSTAANITTRARLGNLLEPLAGASPYYTDATNTIRVLMLDDRELEAITQAQLLSEQNPAAIAYPDGTAEVLQFRDVVDEGDNEWSLSYLLRGRLNTASTEHAAGSRFVMLSGTVFVPLPTALLGQDLILQFVSYGTSPEVAPTYTFTWSPAHSQTEWEPTDLAVTRTGGNVDASWAPRHRFGTEDAPVPSSDFRGYRVVMTDGSTTVTSETTATSLGAADVFTGPVTVSVSQINRVTGPGPAISEVIA